MLHLKLFSTLLFSILFCFDLKFVRSNDMDSTSRSTASLGLIGNPIDVNRPTTGGTVLLGGGGDVDAAFRWMISKSGGGNFVVIRATGTAAYNEYIYNLGSVSSVETLLINSRTLADDSAVERTILNAEALFISGGDQANYVNFWKGTKVQNAINYLRNIKQVPVGGTSAGCAILGEIYFSALFDTVTSAQTLTNPYDQRVTLGYRDFLIQPYLNQVVTDSHFTNRDRHGRMVTFLARIMKDHNIFPQGIGLDEATALCIDSNGIGKVYGSGSAYFFSPNGVSSTPEVCLPNLPLEWYRNKQAVSVYRVKGTDNGTNSFDLNTWKPHLAQSPSYYYVRSGRLYT